MLIGKYQHKIDVKRRLPLPARLRDGLGKTVVITRGLEQSLFVYPMNAWLEFAEKVNALPMSNANARSIARLFFSGAMEVDLDNLGRILVPEYLKDHAQLKKDVVIVGTGTRLEIWDKGRWDRYQMKEVEDMGESVAELKDYGI